MRFLKYVISFIAIEFFIQIFLVTGSNAQVKNGLQVRLTPNGDTLMTATIQHAIDSCSKHGGTVIFPKGTYRSGSIELKSNVSLHFEKGALLQGSNDYKDYKNDAFIFGQDLTTIAIYGEGIIDGVDCYNPTGEEGFRGSHCIKLIRCSKVMLKDFTIQRSANYAINCRYSSDVTLENISIRGGHDGLHTRFCKNFKVNGCDFRTGDDAFAGNDNQNFKVTNCKINTSCNGFRLGCYNLEVKNCTLWGPGEFKHKIQQRNNMLAAFVHFSPKDENPVLPSGNWHLENVQITNVDHVYMYNHASGLWQTGQPFTTISIVNMNATQVLTAFNAIGDEALKFNLNIDKSSFEFREGAVLKDSTFEGVALSSDHFFSVQNFDQINLRNVSFKKNGANETLFFQHGNLLKLSGISFIKKTSSNLYLTRDVKVKKIHRTEAKHP